MSSFSFTRQEQITALLLVSSLLVGGLITLIQRQSRDFAPDLLGESPVHRDVGDTLLVGGDSHELLPPDTVSTARLNINSATCEELMSLPGIGPAMARRITDHRRLRGPFHGVEDLKGVNGIGDKTVKRLKPYIKFE